MLSLGSRCTRVVIVLATWAIAPVLTTIGGCAHEAVTLPSEGTPVQPTAEPTSATPARFASPFAYEWFVRAELYRANRQSAQAIDAYQNALAGDEDPYVLARLASAQDEAGQRGEAEAALARALELEPANAAVWLTQAELAQAHGELERASASYERAETLAPSWARPPLELAAWLRAQGQPERAIAVLERFESRTLASTGGAGQARLRLALDRGDAEGSFNAAQAWLRVAPAAEGELLRSAQALLAQGHAALACRTLDAVPERTDNAALRLRAALACGRDGQAEALLATHDPELFGGRLAVANAYLSIARPQAANVLAQDLVSEQPQDSAALLLGANAALAQGRYAAAASSFASIPRGSSQATQARLGLLVCLRAQGLSALAQELSAQ